MNPEKKGAADILSAALVIMMSIKRIYRKDIENILDNFRKGRYYEIERFKRGTEGGKMQYFDKVKKNFGFGCMRLPMKNGEVDQEQFCRMTDAFLEAGFNYFDTAHGYLNGKSETAIRECVVKRHPRESFTLTNKLTDVFFQSEEEIRPFFEKQLTWCGVDYFDFYLMHAQNAVNFEKYKRCRAYETAFALKEEGKIRHVGISFHDKAKVLDKILTEYPQLELVQIQFNYIDYENPSVESRLCYEVCKKHNKPIVVMEPVKGGMLVNLTPEADKILRQLGEGSNASYAIRFAASFEGVFMTLSGMSTMEQMEDNLQTMSKFRPLTELEMNTLSEVRKELLRDDMIPCTACRYCVEGCPKKISIPELFSCINQNKRYKNRDWNSRVYYQNYTKNNGKASDCIACGKCEKSCPQHLKIRELLKEVARVFEN